MFVIYGFDAGEGWGTWYWGHHLAGPTDFIVFCDEITGVEE